RAKAARDRVFQALRQSDPRVGRLLQE
ncbi:MAG: hypothetical protein XU15_C0004G0001, partial [candidate division NC10 bacterium CSP1-5]